MKKNAITRGVETSISTDSRKNTKISYRNIMAESDETLKAAWQPLETGIPVIGAWKTLTGFPTREGKFSIAITEKIGKKAIHAEKTIDYKGFCDFIESNPNIGSVEHDADHSQKMVEFIDVRAEWRKKIRILRKEVAATIAKRHDELGY